MVQTSQFKGNKKGQATMLDLVLAISVFVIILAMLYTGWFIKIDKAAEELQEFKARISAQKALMALTESPGFPSNWAILNLNPNSDSLKGIGTASSHSTLDSQKVSALANYFNNPDTSTNTRVKMGIAPYNADIRIYYQNGSDISVMGNPPSSSSKILSSMQKPAIYENNTVLVRVRIWE